MGQKVNPHGLRVGVIKGWDTSWYADKKDFGKYLKEDYEIRKFIKNKYYSAGDQQDPHREGCQSHRRHRFHGGPAF